MVAGVERSDSRAGLDQTGRRVWIEVTQQAVGVFDDRVYLVPHSEPEVNSWFEVPIVLKEGGVSPGAEVPQEICSAEKTCFVWDAVEKRRKVREANAALGASYGHGIFHVQNFSAKFEGVLTS